ncbi:MAG: hypothetical protein IKK34_02935 [Clostridia bacterium]|nr:hypothetical protein [Clostridia bacterium]
MKYIFCSWILAFFLMTGQACAQTVDMQEAHLRFDYPDSWLVVSPQLAAVYDPLLAREGLDGLALSEELEALGVHSRAYSEDFAQHMSVLTRTDELAQDIFDMANVTDEQRKTLRRRAENNQLFETTGYRAQDVQWHKERGEYWLYIHYIKTHADEQTGRGARYITVKNGMYVMLDWQLDKGRFTNRDLARFRERIHDLTIEQTADRPVRSTRIEAQIPSETTTSELIVEGNTTPNATIVAETPGADGEMLLLSVIQAGSSGKFSMLIPLEEEGEFDILLTASMDGMLESSVGGHVTYSAKTLPVSLDGIEDGGVHTVTQDETKLTGRTLAGAQMQLVTPYGVSKKRAGGDGAFAFELTTKDEGEYRYTLILDKSGYDQRRFPFTLVRVITDDQQRAAIRKTAEKIAYKQLQKDLDENRGKVMSLYGPVTQVSAGSGGTTFVRIQFNKAADGTWYNPVVIVAPEDMGAKVGDMITAVVTVAGVFEEQDKSGEPLMIPRFELVFVDKVE